MKTYKVTSIAIVSIIIVACSTMKKNITTSAPSPQTYTLDSSKSIATPNTPKTPNTFLLKSKNGIYEPGNEELKAIQLQYKETTLQQLKYGHAIYTEGACVKCHDAFNIYEYSEPKWKIIVDDMAIRAKISNEQKDAVYKYVMAIKATQPK